MPPLLSVENVCKYFQLLKAVDGVSFEICESETLGLVGESGCGKSTLGKLIVNLLPLTSGSIIYEDEELHRLRVREMQAKRKHLRMLFQAPDSMMNPGMTVKEIIEEPLIVHQFSKEERLNRIDQLLGIVRLSKKQHLTSYPHTLSGGEKRRVTLARALAIPPKLLIADEPLSGLDVSTQVEIIQILQRMQRDHGTGMLFISHDLGATRTISHRIAVMYRGKIVEMAPKARFNPNDVTHPYTKILLNSILNVEPSSGNRAIPEIRKPSDSGCRYSPSCQLRKDRGICSNQNPCQTEPELRDIGNGHMAACHFA